MPNQVLGVLILRFNFQDRIVPSGNNCCSSIRVASLDEKSAIDLKEKLLICKHTRQKAIFNARILKRIGQLPELTASTIDHNIDIICIQEHIYTHSEDIKYHDTGKGWTLATAYAWKNLSMP